MANIGELEERGMQNMIWRAFRGHRGEEPREGIWIVAYWDCFWRVFDHFMIKFEKPEWGMSPPPLHKWTKGEKEWMEGGTRLESLRKLKKLRRKTDLYM